MRKILLTLIRVLTTRCTKCGGELEEYTWKRAYCKRCNARN